MKTEAPPQPMIRCLMCRNVFFIGPFAVQTYMAHPCCQTKEEL